MPGLIGVLALRRAGRRPARRRPANGSSAWPRSPRAATASSSAFGAQPAGRDTAPARRRRRRRPPRRAPRRGRRSSSATACWPPARGSRWRAWPPHASDWTAAQQHALAHLDACAEGGHLTWVPGCLDALGEIAAGLGIHDDAVRLFAAARARPRRHGRRPRHPRKRALGRDRRGACATALGDAYATASAEGAALTIDDALEWARRARGPRTRPVAGWQSLTPTEARVAQLVAARAHQPARSASGCSSPRETVKTHLGHVFAKLGVSNRAELAALAARHDTATRDARSEISPRWGMFSLPTGCISSPDQRDGERSRG